MILGGIYSNACVTIAAHIGNSADSGCFDGKSSGRDDEMSGLVKISNILHSGCESTVACSSIFPVLSCQALCHRQKQ